MSGRVYPDLSELSYHIINLCDFWRRENHHDKKDHVIRVVSGMIGIFLGIDNADQVARAVVSELDAVRVSQTDRQVDPDGIEVVFISALLREQSGELAVPSTTAYWSSVFDVPAT